MKLISWNVNGLRACMGKGWQDFFDAADADFFCLQETKLQEGQISLILPGYHQYWNYAEKKGYSGTAIFAKQACTSAAEIELPLTEVMRLRIIVAGAISNLRNLKSKE